MKTEEIVKNGWTCNECEKEMLKMNVKITFRHFTNSRKSKWHVV